ncbi:MAG: hypothetical protein IJO79_00665 [Firmicutes bacterium]|nr:hypothetical protein [Bacillota bacterium]
MSLRELLRVIRGKYLVFICRKREGNHGWMVEESPLMSDRTNILTGYQLLCLDFGQVQRVFREGKYIKVYILMDGMEGRI